MKKTPAFRYVWYCTSPKSRGQDSVQDFSPLAEFFPDFWSALRGEIQMFLMTSRQDRSRSVLARSASHLCWDWNRSQISDFGFEMGSYDTIGCVHPAASSIPLHQLHHSRAWEQSIRSIGLLRGLIWLWRFRTCQRLDETWDDPQRFTFSFFLML